MATPNLASESPSGEETRNVPRSDCSPDGDPKYLDTSLDIFFINFCIILSLRSNFQFVRNHLSLNKPHLLFRTETQLYEDPQNRRCLWRFASASWGDLRRYYADFPWNDFCFRVRDPSLCTQRITEVTVSGMEAYIPHSFSQPKPSKPWFNTASSHATHDREVATKGT
ncbi:hypothetical protein E2C01_063828 [Portunus trituberculatus]|uniref:Uncharacterized protein n=1 Tax=Portunus trituberculatus TaxID=210409 RepID=A0A5B7HLL5_PORTR|nr:hypothetical protein [Portunus trituberculatus]